MNSKRKMAWGVVIFSIALVVLYDFRNLLKNRPIACDIQNPHCPIDRVCSKPAFNLGARCLPLATTPTVIFSLPFETNQPIECRIPNLDGKYHVTDFNLFSLTFVPRKPSTVVASGAGELVIHNKEIRIRHSGGYVTTYEGLNTIAVRPGPIAEGQVLGSVTNSLEFGVHYFNPRSELQLLGESPEAGFSVPFEMRIQFENSSPHQLNSKDIPCGDSPTAIYRTASYR